MPRKLKGSSSSIDTSRHIVMSGTCHIVLRKNCGMCVCAGEHTDPTTEFEARPTRRLWSRTQPCDFVAAPHHRAKSNVWGSLIGTSYFPPYCKFVTVTGADKARAS